MTSVVFTRGGLEESVHDVAWCVTDGGGSVTAASDGDAELHVFGRSTLKPLQARPALDAGVLEAFGLGSAHFALACASHGGAPKHLAVVREILSACGLSEDDLGCGPLEPRDPTVAAAMRRSGEQPTRLHHNCSGKHALALAFCVHQGWPVAGYLEPEHPLQQAMHGAVASAVEQRPADVPYGGDGCGMLAFSVPLAGLARAYGTLAPSIGDPMRAHPDLVAFDGALDTELMRAEPGLVAKIGAEGVLAVGLPGGRGLAVKVRDGAMRALDPAGVMLVRDVLACAADSPALDALARPRMTNSRGETVGEGEARV